MPELAPVTIIARCASGMVVGSTCGRARAMPSRQRGVVRGFVGERSAAARGSTTSRFSLANCASVCATGLYAAVGTDDAERQLVRRQIERRQATRARDRNRPSTTKMRRARRARADGR